MAQPLFSSQRAAKAFFIERILAQAEAEGVQLSENERWMLRFSESDPDFAVDSARVGDLEAEVPEEDYERKIAGLVHRAYQADARASGSATAQYREAAAVLHQGDHYLLVMIDRALGSVNPGTTGGPAVSVAVQAAQFVLLVVPGVVAILIAFGLLATVISEGIGPVREVAAFVLGSAAFGGSGYYLIHLWLRERRRRRSAASQAVAADGARCHP
jgi:hypothetical protein